MGWFVLWCLTAETNITSPFMTLGYFLTVNGSHGYGTSHFRVVFLFAREENHFVIEIIIEKESFKCLFLRKIYSF